MRNYITKQSKENEFTKLEKMITKIIINHVEIDPELASNIAEEITSQVIDQIMKPLEESAAHILDLTSQLAKATYREKNWQTVAGQLASAGNGIYGLSIPRIGSSQNDLDKLEQHREFIFRYLEFNEDI